MTGPAHHTAASAALSNADGRSNGSPPSATSTATPTAMWVSGPASEIASVHGREIGLLAWYDVNPAMNSSEIEAVGAGPAGDEGMGQLVDQRERGDRPGEPPAELAAVVEERRAAP